MKTKRITLEVPDGLVSAFLDFVWVDEDLGIVHSSIGLGTKMEDGCVFRIDPKDGPHIDVDEHSPLCQKQEAQEDE